MPAPPLWWRRVTTPRSWSPCCPGSDAFVLHADGRVTDPGGLLLPALSYSLSSSPSRGRLPKLTRTRWNPLWRWAFA